MAATSSLVPGAIQMKVKSIKSRWFEQNGYRFDCNPYMSGAIEARAKLNTLACDKNKLSDLVNGHKGGIYNGPMFSRTWTEDPEFGVPFLGSTSMLKSDLSGLPLLSKALATSPKLSYLETKKGMILISCSGTIGKMVYARSDMEGMWSSQHIMKVSPDRNKVASGYLYTYLSSKYGIPLIVSGTYGAIIQHIEPHHIADLPVPRLGPDIELQCHNLIEESSSLRSKAVRKLDGVAKRFDALVKNINLNEASPRISIVKSKSIQSRFDAQFHDSIVQSIKDIVSEKRHTSIGKWCSKVFLPGIFKRIHVDNLEHGSYYYTGASLFWLEPKPKGILSRQTSRFDEVYLEKGMILVQAFGQDGGLTGRSVWVGDHLHGQTTTHMLVRLQSDNIRKDAFLFGFLQSDMAYKQIACLTYGGSIPHFDEAGISTVLMPLFDDTTFNEIADDVLWAMDARDRALANEKKARRIVEDAIDAVDIKH